jgi:hypothetical protein
MIIVLFPAKNSRFHNISKKVIIMNRKGAQYSRNSAKLVLSPDGSNSMP